MSDSISEKQLAANRANAALSTGPRTPEGKARSSQNARKHGFTATFGVLAMEDLEEIERLKTDLIAAHQPVNNQELFALEQIAIAQQSLRRAARMHTMSRDSNAWTQFLRYQAHAQRKYRFAVEEFERLVMQRDELYQEDFENEELQNEPIFDAELQENEITSTRTETNPFSTAAQTG
jgi:hypothetical protein